MLWGYFFGLRFGSKTFFGLSFLAFGTFLGFKNIFGTYLCRQSTLVYEVQSFLFVLILQIWGLFCTFWVLRGYFLGLGSGSKTFLGLCTTICSTALKVKIFFDLAQFETFCVFWSFWAIFGVGFSFKNFFETCLYRQSTLVLEVQPYLSFFI